jgi:LuxR family maltose regulon positive regulatory protein
MSTPLLKTKLYIPPARSELVPRPRLIERLNAGLRSGRKLSLVSAPAGFGKTTLLSEWIHSGVRSRKYGVGEEHKLASEISFTPYSLLPTSSFAWVSLDEGDNDPIHFWSYFFAALQTALPDVGENVLQTLQSPQPPPIKMALTLVINEVVERSIALILDDYHLIEVQPIHDGLAFLLDHLPPQMHLVIATRADPPLPLHSLRARDQLMELRARDLRFTLEETAAFFSQTMGLGLSSEDVAALVARTEGWIAGLQLAALSMQGLPRKGFAPRGQDTTAFVKTFSGSHRFILGYLMEEVLGRQPDDVQGFLLETAILERMTAPLCEAVTQRDDSREMLEHLERANLFIVPLDDEGHWYRYHHMFAELLCGRLQQTRPDQVSFLHRRASAWYEREGLLPEAVSHALAGEDVEWAIRLIERDALAMLDHGELATVLGWLDALPDEVVRARPWLCVAYAWALADGGRLDDLKPLLRDAEQAFDSEMSASDRQRIKGHIATIRAYSANMLGDLARAEEFAQEALEWLPEEDLKTRSLAAKMRALLLYARGDVELAGPAFDEALAISRAADDPHRTVLILCEQALFQLALGQLCRAADTCREALRLAEASAQQGGRPLPIASYAHTRMASVLREWNDLDAALRHARESIRLSKQWGQMDILLTGYFDLVWTLQATGDVEGALDAIREAQQIARDASGQDYFPLERAEAQIRLLHGDVAAAARWVEQMGLSAEDEFDCFQGFTYLTLARLLLAQADWRRGELLEKALRLLERILLQAEATGFMRLAIQTLLLQSLALQAKGDVEQALTSLERALAPAEPEGFVRSFVDMGAPMADLLRMAAARGIAVEYVTKLLTALNAEHPRPPASLSIEPLSKRELEVLRLLATGSSNKDIATTLVISVTTVKKHLQNIYGTLNVHSRTQAVDRARNLGLL